MRFNSVDLDEGGSMYARCQDSTQASMPMLYRFQSFSTCPCIWLARLRVYFALIVHLHVHLSLVVRAHDLSYRLVPYASSFTSSCLHICLTD